VLLYTLAVMYKRWTAFCFAVKATLGGQEQLGPDNYKSCCVVQASQHCARDRAFVPDFAWKCTITACIICSMVALHCYSQWNYVYRDSTACKARKQRHSTPAYKAGHARKAVSTWNYVHGLIFLQTFIIIIIIIIMLPIKPYTNPADVVRLQVFWPQDKPWTRVQCRLNTCDCSLLGPSIA
jgi:hypothetical protein